MKKRIIKCIVKNEIYEVAIFNEATNTPVNTAIVEHCNCSRLHRDYQLPNGIIANIVGVYGREDSVRKAVFTFNDVVIKEVVSKNFQSYADHLNMFNDMEQEELDAYVLNGQNETKTTLEKNIEELKLQKAALEEELHKYIVIAEKKLELDQLIKELNQ